MHARRYCEPVVTPAISKADPCADRVYVNLNDTTYWILSIHRLGNGG